jgi:D-alanyl-D-alanine carboxypeptidase
MATASTLDDRLEAVVRSGLPGVVAVASGPGRHEEGAAGLANVATDEPLTVEHRFRVASVTKVFIATAVLQLAGEGAIELDGDAGPLVPGVTVRQLLNHTSGVPNAADDFGAFLEPYRMDPAHKSEFGPSEMLARSRWSGRACSRPARAGHTRAATTRRWGCWSKGPPRRRCGRR